MLGDRHTALRRSARGSSCLSRTARGGSCQRTGRTRECRRSAGRAPPSRGSGRRGRARSSARRCGPARPSGGWSRRGWGPAHRWAPSRAGSLPSRLRRRPSLCCLPCFHPCCHPSRRSSRRRPRSRRSRNFLVVDLRRRSGRAGQSVQRDVGQHAVAVDAVLGQSVLRIGQLLELLYDPGELADR